MRIPLLVLAVMTSAPAFAQPVTKPDPAKTEVQQQTNKAEAAALAERERRLQERRAIVLDQRQAVEAQLAKIDAQIAAIDTKDLSDADRTRLERLTMERTALQAKEKELEVQLAAIDAGALGGASSPPPKN